MNSLQQTPSLDLIEKTYSYRNVWSQTIGVLVFGGLGILGMAWLAITKGLLWAWLFAIFFLLLFVLGVWIAVVNIQGKLRFMISKDGIYIPSAFRPQSHTFVRFSEINAAKLMEIYGNINFLFSAKDKQYSITKSWFPVKNDFEEIVEIILNRSSAQLK